MRRHSSTAAVRSCVPLHAGGQDPEGVERRADLEPRGGVPDRHRIVRAAAHRPRIGVHALRLHRAEPSASYGPAIFNTLLDGRRYRPRVCPF